MRLGVKVPLLPPLYRFDAMVAKGTPNAYERVRFLPSLPFVMVIVAVILTSYVMFWVSQIAKLETK